MSLPKQDIKSKRKKEQRINRFYPLKNKGFCVTKDTIRKFGTRGKK